MSAKASNGRPLHRHSNCSAVASEVLAGTIGRMRGGAETETRSRIIEESFGLLSFLFERKLIGNPQNSLGRRSGVISSNVEALLRLVNTLVYLIALSLTFRLSGIGSIELEVIRRGATPPRLTILGVFNVMNFT